MRNFGAPPTKLKEQERNSAFHTIALVYQPGLAAAVFEGMMKTPVINVSTEELLSLALEVCAKFRKAVTPQRVPPTGQRTVAFTSIGGASTTPGMDQEELSCFRMPLEPGGFVLPDLYDVYLRDVAPSGSGESPPLKNTKESHALWLIVGLVDTKEYVEVIVDPGCMIVAMLEYVAHVSLPRIVVRSHNTAEHVVGERRGQEIARIGAEHAVQGLDNCLVPAGPRNL